MGKARFSCIWIFFLLVWMIFVFNLGVPAAIAASANDSARKFEPVEILGEYFPDLVGKKISCFRLYAYIGGEFKTIPYQIDERTEDLKFVMPEGREGDPSLADGKFDVQDLLVFYARDVGEKAPAVNLPSGASVTKEIKLIDPIGNFQGWCYLSFFPDNPPPNNFPSYLNLIESGKQLECVSRNYYMKTFANEFKGVYYKTAIPDFFMAPIESGGTGENLIDRMKFRTRARFFFGLAKFGSDEEFFIGGVDEYRIGPVRCYARNWACLVLPFNFKTPKLWADIYCWDTFVTVPLLIRLPINPGLLITDASIIVGFDMNQKAYGMKFYNNHNMKGFLIDGKMDEDEKRLVNAVDDWRCVTGPQGTIISGSIWDESYRQQADIKVDYLDDTDSGEPPDYFPGSIGYHGSRATIEYLEPRNYRAILYFFFPPNFYDPQRFKLETVSEFLNIRDHPLQIVVGDRELTNTVGNPAFLSPQFKERRN